LITWLDDPTVFEYVRESILYRRSKRGLKCGAKLPIKSFYRLVGYEWEGKGVFRIFWLKTYDRGCPNELEAYRKGRQPGEARSTFELLRNTKQN